MILGETLVYQNWLSLRLLTIRAANGEIVQRHVEDHGSAASVLPYDAERRTALLVSQPRAAVMLAGEDEVLEAIAGCIEPGEAAENSIAREGLEEAGVRINALELVCRSWAMPGVSTERNWLYLARYGLADRVADGGGAAHENEQITVHEVALARLAEMADTGDLPDMKTLLLVQTLRLRHPDLFI